jgi:hypothetical protein
MKVVMRTQHLGPIFIDNGTLHQAVKKFAIHASVGPDIYLFGSIGNVQEKSIDFKYFVGLNTLL